MKKQGDRDEIEIGRLIRAGVPLRARPDPLTRSILLERLERETVASGSDYPKVVLGVLAALWCLLVGSALFGLGGLRSSLLANEALLFLLPPAMINLALSPVAGLAVVINRRRYGKT